MATYFGVTWKFYWWSIFVFVFFFVGSMLTVYASEGNDALKKVAGPVMNDPKVVAADNVLKGEWHVQLIKLFVVIHRLWFSHITSKFLTPILSCVPFHSMCSPLPDPSTPVDKRGDVPHVGLQVRSPLEPHHSKKNTQKLIMFIFVYMSVRRRELRKVSSFLECRLKMEVVDRLLLQLRLMVTLVELNIMVVVVNVDLEEVSIPHPPTSSCLSLCLSSWF